MSPVMGQSAPAAPVDLAPVTAAVDALDGRLDTVEATVGTVASEVEDLGEAVGAIPVPETVAGRFTGQKNSVTHATNNLPASGGGTMTPEYTTPGVIENGSSNLRIPSGKPGVYQVRASIRWGAACSLTRLILRLEGAVATEDRRAPGAEATPTNSVDFEFVATGDGTEYFDLLYYQENGSSASRGCTLLNFSLTRLGDAP